MENNVMKNLILVSREPLMEALEILTAIKSDIIDKKIIAPLMEDIKTADAISASLDPGD